MKLALVTRRYPPFIGGAEKVLSYLAPALAAEGADVTVLTSHAPGLAEMEDVAAPDGRLRIVRLAAPPRLEVGAPRHVRRPAGAREGARHADRGLAPGPGQAPRRAADPGRRRPPARRPGGARRAAEAGRLGGPAGRVGRAGRPA